MEPTQIDKMEAKINETLALVQGLAAALFRQSSDPAATSASQGAPDPAALALWLFPAPGADPEALRQRDANLDRESARLESTPIVGSSGVKANELNAEDRAYMRHLQQNAVHRLAQAGKARNQDVYRALLSGSHAEISKAIHDGEHSNEWAAWRVDMAGHVGRYMSEGNKALIQAYNVWIQSELAK